MNYEHYETSDLGLAAALVCLDFKLIELNVSNPRRVLFYFSGDENINGVQDRFWNHQIEVDAQSYFQAIKMLKSRLYGASQWN